MFKRLLPLLLLVLLVLACNFSLAQEEPVVYVTETPLSPTTTSTATIDEPTTTEPSPVNTATTGPPTSTPCYWNATYVADVSIPDGAEVVTGTTFTKTWRLKNTGCQFWGAGVTLAFLDGEHMGGPSYVDINPTAPGGTVEVSVALTAPNTPGNYRGNWRVKTPSGYKMEDIFVEINAVAPTPTPTLTPTLTPTPTVTNTPTNTVVPVVEFDIYDKGVELCGSTLYLWIRVENTGNVTLESTWTKMTDVTTSTPHPSSLFISNAPFGSNIVPCPPNFQDSLPPGQTAILTMLPGFPLVSGHNISTTSKMYTLEGQNGDMVARTVTVTVP